MGREINNLVLVVDDDTSFRALMADILNSIGLEVAEARSAREASAILAGGNPVLAIVDYRLPEIDGMTWVSSVREAGRYFPIVFLSGSWFDEKTFNVLRNILKVSLILRKPIAAELFLQQIESLLPPHIVLKSRMSLSVSEIASPQTIEQVDEAIASAQPDDDLDQLRNIRSKLEREEKIAAARVNYAKELSELWNQLARAVSLTQQDDNDADSKNEAINLAHKIRGTAGSIGFTRAGEAAGRIEDLLMGLDPGDTLKDVIWKGIFRALADGDMAVRRSLEKVKEPGAKANAKPASRILLLSNDQQGKVNAEAAKTSRRIEIEFLQDPEAVLQTCKKNSLDAAIIDVRAIGKEKLFAVTKEIRQAPGHEALPLAFICGPGNSLDEAELAYVGCSVLITDSPTKEDIEVIIDQLLSCRRLQKPRILSVDDDEVLTQYISTILEAEDMHVMALNQPILIMEAVEEFKPDLILLDVIMPGLSGYDVCRMLRASEGWKKLPILFLTSRSDQQGRAAAYQAGGNDFLSKPVLADELITRVKAQLNIATSFKLKPAKDAATGALQSDDFINGMKNMLVYATENDLALTFALLRLDDFVPLTLAHGWNSVQGALAVLGKLIQSRFKAEDLRGRLGEDAFILAFLGEEMETMTAAIEKLLNEFCDIKQTSETSGTFNSSFSAGLAVFPNDGSSIEDLLSIANERLLSARLEQRDAAAKLG